MTVVKYCNYDLIHCVLALHLFMIRVFAVFLHLTLYS